MNWFERSWEGRAAVIVAGGASFSAAQARLIGMTRARDAIRVIAVNDAVYPCWFADMLYACDAKWWRRHVGVPGFPGIKVRLIDRNDEGKDKSPLDYPDVLGVEKSGTQGFEPRPGFVRTGGNGGQQAIQIAVHLGADPVILVGFDMHGPHWFGDHPAPLSKHPANFPNRVLDMQAMCPGLTSKVLNASPGSSIKCFPFVDLEAALAAEEKRHGIEAYAGFPDPFAGS